MPRFQRLHAWHLARTVLHNIHRLTEDLRGNAELRSQMRRAALSIVSNIAEGSERGSYRDFCRFLAIARGSCSELLAQVIIAGDCGHIEPAAIEAISDPLDHLGRMLTRLMSRLTSPDP